MEGTRDVSLSLNMRVRGYIRQHSLFDAGEAVVVAVSGGADSLCLLSILHALAPELDLRLHVAHLDHALRSESAADAAFVAAQAAMLGLPCTVERRDVPAFARDRRLSLETAAREVRYDFLRVVATAQEAQVIATGHTRDDQAETVLMHLARGSGLNGLVGMAPRRDNLVRPLLDASHAEAVAYCDSLGLTPREDESNRSPRYRRNRVRHDIMPRLEGLYPGAGANLARSARILAGDLAVIERLARRALDQAITARTETAAAPVVLSAARWNESEPELRPHMLRLLLQELLGRADGFGEREYALMLAVCAPAASDSAVDLPKGLVLRRAGDIITLGWRRPKSMPSPLREAVLPIPGRAHTEAGWLHAEIVAAPRAWTDIAPTTAYLDPAAAGSLLTVRAWRPGDRVRPLGLGGTRKVQDIFVDRKVPRSARGRIPIVEGVRGIAWIAGLCTSEDYRVERGEEAVRLTWRQEAGD